MIDSESKRKLGEMGVAELAEALNVQSDPAFTTMPFAERIQMAVDAVYEIKSNAQIQGLIRRSKLRYPESDVNRIIYDERRDISRAHMLDLATCRFLETNTNVVFGGYCGSGKSFMGCMLAKEACKRKIRARYVRMPDLIEEYEIASSSPQEVKKLLRRYAGYRVLVVDEWLLDILNDRQIAFLLELTERRYNAGSTIFCTQYPESDWHSRLGGGVPADAIMDRIVHNCIWIEMGDFNMRKHLGEQVKIVDSSIRSKQQE